jgi:hypothetical protein
MVTQLRCPKGDSSETPEMADRSNSPASAYRGAERPVRGAQRLAREPDSPLDLGLLGQLERVVHIDSEISDR